MPYADVETSSVEYARRFAGPVGEFFLERQARLSLELLRRFAGASVLDVGGGHGQLARPLAQAGFAVTVLGSEASCRERLADELDAARVRFETGDLLAAPFSDRSFDVVVCYRLLPHVAEWRRLVAELGRLARRAVLVDYPTRRSANVLSGATFSLKRHVEGNTRPFLVFRDAELREAFAAAGFHVGARRPQLLLPMALHRGLGLAALSRAAEGLAAALGLTRAFGSPVLLLAERDG